MLDCYDQDELLAYIEDDLAPDEAAAMRRRLEADPSVAELVEAIREDRARLMAEPEPRLPVDFAAQLESMLVRPMLMDEPAAMPVAYRPGRERRKHRRQRHLRAVRRLAIAAAIALVAIGGVWVAYNNINIPRGGQQMAAASDAQSSGSKATAGSHAGTTGGDGVDGPATIHHHLPSPGFAVEAMASAEGRASAVGSRDGGSVAVDFILVVQTTDTAATERLLTQLAGNLNEPVALVQNFSYDEAKRLEQAWLLSQREERRPTERATASRVSPATVDGFDELAERARQQRRQARPSVPVETSQQLHGPREMAATLAQQLEFSSRGATHTITIPLEQLQALLAGLASEQGHTTWLQLLPDDPAALSLTASFGDRAAVQQSLKGLQTGGGGVLVHLPVRLAP